MKTVLAISILLLSLLLPMVSAQATYTIPLEEASWWTNRINVQIPSSPSWAHNCVVPALKTWNQAQTWFRDTYYPTGSVYTLIESQNTNPDVTVNFTVSLVNGQYRGQTFYTTTGNYFDSGVKVTISLKSDTCIVVTIIAIHEFGHVLGLDHATYPEDLMYVHAITASGPSTLDLYAVHMVAQHQVSSSVTLPLNIPYTTEIPTPEFPSSLVLIFVLTLGILVTRKLTPRD